MSVDRAEIDMGRRRDVEHKCGVCGRGFSMSGHLTRHKAVHTGDRPYICSAEGCDKSYARKDNLHRHELSAHSRNQWEYECDVPACCKKFPTANKLKRHRDLHDRPTPYECDDCGQTFRKKRQLATHRSLHTGKLPYPCTEDGCERVFATPSKLRKHLLWHSWGDDRYVCLEGNCAGKESFDKFSQLQKHMKAVHPPSPKECEECGRRFRTSSGLRKHVQTHESVAADRKRFECEFASCIAAFTSRSNLRSHIRSKHTQPNAFGCPTCGQSFSYLVVLQRHMRSIHNVSPAASRRRGAADTRSDACRSTSWSQTAQRRIEHGADQSAQHIEEEDLNSETADESACSNFEILAGGATVELAGGSVGASEKALNRRKRRVDKRNPTGHRCPKRMRYRLDPRRPMLCAGSLQPDQVSTASMRPTLGDDSTYSNDEREMPSRDKPPSQKHVFKPTLPEDQVTSILRHPEECEGVDDLRFLNRKDSNERPRKEGLVCCN